ncbi:prealbumin-like fold domain-containing protein [Solilutibacter silvestris]|uniref:prealbumin-like fold domain-containing protein n=1 Tax=Solilutibacter silvestris TaxID=1645665 RepID=UPI003D33DB7E
MPKAVAKSEVFRGLMTRVLWLVMALACAQSVSAQTCTAIPQRTTNPTMASLTNWTAGGGWTSISILGSPAGAQIWTNNANGSTLSQNLTRVSGGAVLQFDVAWNNAEAPSGPPNWVDGNQTRLDVVYAGVVYASIFTSTWQGGVNMTRPGPTTGSTITMQNGATLLSGNNPPLPTNLSTAFTWNTLQMQLPDNVVQSGLLEFKMYRMQNAAGSGGADDDFYLRNATVADRTLCVVKSTPIGSGTFAFTSTNLDTDLATAGNQTALSITTAGATAVAYDADTGTAGAQPSFVNANPVTVTETVPTGFNLTSATCDNGVTGTISGGNKVTFSTVPGGTQATCTLTNSRPRIRLQKALPGGRLLATDQFTLTVSGPRNASNTTATVTTTGSGTTATGVADFNPGDAGGSYTLSEAAAGTTVMAVYNPSISCSNATAGSSTVLPSGSGTSFTLTAAAADDITCTFSNPQRPLPTVTVRKTSLGSTGTFNFSGTNGIANQAITTATVGTPQAGAAQTLTAGLTATTVTEVAPPAGFILQSITCTGLGAGGTATPTINGASGGSVLLDAAATAYGSNIVCTFTNTNQADLSITKTNSVTTVTSGTSTTYTLVVNNNGPAPVTGAVVKDAPVSGLTCPAGNAVTCSGTGCPAGPLTMSSLTSGVTMGTMAANTSATFTVTCNVN